MFTGGADGRYPAASLTNDRATGTLYGTAYGGGNAGCGTAFQLNPTNGQFSVLYTFQGGSDGCHPFTQLREGVKSGTLIGALVGGEGALFLLTEKGGTWKNSILHNFTGGTDGGFPYDLTILTGDGTNSIYGVALYGGLYNSGVVFQLSRPARKWQYDVIYNFAGGNDGPAPRGIHLDNVTGTLYGTTESWRRIRSWHPVQACVLGGQLDENGSPQFRRRLRWGRSCVSPDRRPTDRASLRHHLRRR